MSGVKTVAEIAVIADTKQAREEMKKLADATGKTFDEVQKQVGGLKTLGNKWEELSKSMVGLQMHDAFKRIADKAKEATNGVLDLNAAFAGYQIAGPWGAAIGAVAVPIAEASRVTKLLNIDLDEMEHKAGSLAREHIPPLIAGLWKQVEASEALNARWVELPRTLSYVFQSFTDLRKVLKDVDKDIKANDESMRKTFVGMFVGATDKASRGVKRATPSAPVDSRPSRGGYEGFKAAPDYYIERGLGQRSDSASRDEFGRESSLSLLAANSLTEKLTANWYALSQQLGSMGNGPTVLERMFGKKEEIDGYHEAFSALTGTATAAFGALVDGNMSAGDAVKKFIKDTLKGLGSRMLIRSIEETAEGVAALSNPFTAVSAASHFKAAGLFLAGAAAAGYTASQIGGGSGGGGGSSGRAPNVSGSGGGGTRTIERIIVYGDAFAEDSPRGKQLQAKRMVARALGSSAVEEN